MQVRGNFGYHDHLAETALFSSDNRIRGGIITCGDVGHRLNDPPRFAGVAPESIVLDALGQDRARHLWT